MSFLFILKEVSFGLFIDRRDQILVIVRGKNKE